MVDLCEFQICCAQPEALRIREWAYVTYCHASDAAEEASLPWLKAEKRRGRGEVYVPEKRLGMGPVKAHHHQDGFSIFRAQPSKKQRGRCCYLVVYYNLCKAHREARKTSEGELSL